MSRLIDYSTDINERKKRCFNMSGKVATGYHQMVSKIFRFHE